MGGDKVRFAFCGDKQYVCKLGADKEISAISVCKVSDEPLIFVLESLCSGDHCKCGCCKQ